MNFYGVTLGAYGNIYNPNAPRDPYVAPYPAWPGHNNDSPTTVDDIWHATINTRGEYINARTPNAITAAMRRVLASVSAGSSPSGTIALTGSRIGAGSMSVVPFYEARNDGTDWYSTLTAQSISVAPNTGIVSFNTEWEASTRLPAADVRNNVWFGRGNAAPLPFDSSNVSLDDLCTNPRPGMSLCTGAQIAALGGAGTPLTADDAIAYLKGDQSNEVDRSPTGKLRFRTTPLGDIVNSTPIVSAPGDDYGYRGLPALWSFVPDYLTTTRRRAVDVVCGCNAGMLHSFDGRTTLGGGVERFASFPRASRVSWEPAVPVSGGQRGCQKFKHRYFRRWPAGGVRRLLQRG